MELLTEKYRPRKIEDLVVINQEFGDKLKQWKENKSIDSHLLFYGPPGTGKSSSVNVIINELGVKDYIIVNGSDKTGIDDTRKLIEYASVPPLDDGQKIVIVEEFERLSPQAQDSLKYVLEKYSDWCRFIFTTNNINKVTAPILSRCQAFCFNHLDTKSFVVKIIDILNNENIINEVDDVTNYINASYPDLRKCINLINKNTIVKDGNNVLQPFNKDDISGGSDKVMQLVSYINGSVDCLTTQKYIATSCNEEDIEFLYKFLYNNLGMITPNVNKWEVILVKIAEYMFRHPTVAFKDLNLMACLTEIKRTISHS
jgi:DNA polymerase III gamma/tau subunit